MGPRLRGGVLLCAFFFLLAPSAFGSDDCNHKMWKWTVDKKAAIDLQKLVNDGRQPWRMDDTAAVASEAIQARKKEWADNDTVVEAAKPISQTRDTALMAAASKDGHIRYEVTLRKYSWLLHSAHDHWDWIIWFAARVQRIECPTPPQ